MFLLPNIIEKPLKKANNVYHHILGYREVPINTQSVYRVLNEPMLRDLKNTGLIRTTQEDDLINFSAIPDRVHFTKGAILEYPREQAKLMDSYAARNYRHNLMVYLNPEIMKGFMQDYSPERVKRVALRQMESSRNKLDITPTDITNKIYSVSPIIHGQTNNLPAEGVLWYKNILGRFQSKPIISTW